MFLKGVMWQTDTVIKWKKKKHFLPSWYLIILSHEKLKKKI